MKKLSTVSLFIFGVISISILTSGLVFYQNNKGNGNQRGLIEGEINKINLSGKSITLDMAEIKKHNKPLDCYILVSGKVYNITSYFGSHPGGNSTMSPTCGTDATAAYATRDPYATKSDGNVSHSSDAKNMLDAYYIGDFNQTFNTNTNINPVVISNPRVELSQSNTVKSNGEKAVITPISEITLTMTEIIKHNKQSDCFLLISGKVYNITSYFGSHPGGNSKMLATCGTDATDAYMTKDPNATSTSGGKNHSSGATQMLSNYYIGNLNQTIGKQAVTSTNSVVAPKNVEDDDEWDD